MIRMTGTATVDGVQQPFVAGPAAMSLFEQYASRNNLTFDTAPMTGAMYLAYVALHQNNWPPKEGFDAWRFRVEDLEIEDEATEVPPTPTA